MGWNAKKMNMMIVTQYIIDITTCFLISILSMPYILNLNVPYLNTDEFGYWGSAAFFAGYDWSTVISSNGYFSYGYGIILALLFKCTKSPFVRFKLALLLNSLFLMGLYFVLKKIVILILGKIEWKHCIYCMAATIYCALITYLGISLPECLLSFLFSLNVYLLLQFSKTHSWKHCIEIMLLSLYMYIVHQRTIVFLIINSGWIILYILGNKKKIKKLDFLKGTVLFIGICIIFIGIIMLKKEVQNSVWLISQKEGNVVVGNDYSGQLGKIRYFFTKEGFVEYIYSFCGRIFYLITSTYGYIIAFFIVGIRSIFSSKESKIVKFAYMYLLLSVISVVGISSLFLIMSQTTTYLFYGRYSENILPVIMVIVFIFMNKIHIKDICLCVIVTIILGLISQNKICYEGSTFIQNTSISHVAMNKYYSNEGINIFLICSIIIFFLCFFSVILLKSNKFKMTTVSVMLIYIYLHIDHGYAAFANFYNEKSISNIEQVIALAQEVNDRDIKKLYVVVKDEEIIGKSDKYGKIIQYVNEDLAISLCKEIPQNGVYFVAHADTVMKGEITILEKNAGYILGFYEKNIKTEEVSYENESAIK